MSGWKARKWKPSGSTPMISRDTPFTVSVRPRTEGSAPKRRRQYPLPRRTVSGVSGVSSSAEKVRPMAGWMPSIGST